MRLSLLDLMLWWGWWWWRWKLLLACLLDEFMHIDELPTVSEQVARLYFTILGIGIRMQVARVVDLLSVG